MDKYEKKVLEDIEKYGCSIIQVLEEGNQPRFSYSIGIEKQTGQPDITIFGLKHEVAKWLINEYNRRVKSGDLFQIDKFYNGFLEGFKVTFKNIILENYKEYFGWGIWYNDGYDFTMLQLVLPSTLGTWPWDDNVNDDYKRQQPLLNTKLTNA